MYSFFFRISPVDFCTFRTNSIIVSFCRGLRFSLSNVLDIAFVADQVIVSFFSALSAVLRPHLPLVGFLFRRVCVRFARFTQVYCFRVLFNFVSTQTCNRLLTSRVCAGKNDLNFAMSLPSPEFVALNRIVQHLLSRTNCQSTFVETFVV